MNIPEKNYIEYSFELNLTLKWMNESYFESIFAIFDEKPPFLSILDTFWAIFGHFSYSTSINDPLTIELNYLLNWISRTFFRLNNILNWILGTAILNRILNESFFGKIQTLNWIRVGIAHPYLEILLPVEEKYLWHWWKNMQKLISVKVSFFLRHPVPGYYNYYFFICDKIA